MSEQMNDNQIKRMVDRFLGWKLPENFNPDGGISFERVRNKNTPWPRKNEPTGTNLLDADQAEAMVRYIVAEPSPEPEGALDTSQNSPETWDRPDLDYLRTSGISADRDRESDAQSGNPWYPTDEPQPSPEPEAAPEGTPAWMCGLEKHVASTYGGITRTPASASEAQSGTSALYVTKAAYNARLAELAQLRARVAILDAQKVELPELPAEAADDTLDGWYELAYEARCAQLLGALRAVQAQRTIMRDLRNGLVAARDFIDSGNSGWFPQQWRDAIAAYDALAGRDGE